jgi:hypothetical protein
VALQLWELQVVGDGVGGVMDARGGSDGVAGGIQ